MRPFAFLFVLVFSLSASAQDINVRVEPDEVEEGQVFQYVIDVNVRGNQEIVISEIPDFGSFDVLSKHQMPRLIDFNGNVQRGLATQIKLRAKKKGTFRFEKPVVMIGKKRHRGSETSVTVVPKGSRRAKKQNITKSSRYFLEVERSPERDPYVGEQITLSYHLFTEGFGMDVSPRPPDEPELNEFWIEDLSQLQSGVAKRVQRGSRLFRQTQMRRYALFPLKAGAITIEPMEMDLATGSMFRSRTIRLASDEIPLNVRPLPPNAPAGFYEGNVGEWALSAKVSGLSTRVGQPIHLDLTVSGFGQIGRVRVPSTFEIPNATIVLVGENSERANNSARVGGRRTATFSITPTKEGVMTIPSVTLSYFDPEKEAYQSTTTDPVEIRVAPGSVTPAEEKPPVVVDNDRGSSDDMIRDLREKLIDYTPGETSTSSSPSVPFTIWWVLSFLIVVAIVYSPVRERWRARQTAKREAMENDPSYQVIHALESGESAGKVISTLARSVLGLPLGSLTAKKLERALNARGVPDDAVRTIIDTYEREQKAKYDPGVSAANTDRSSLERAVRAALSIVAFLSLLIPSLAHATDRAKPEPADHAKEIQAFRTSVHAQDDPDALYRFGTASAFLEHYGDARWALERAIFLRPFFSDAEANLDTISQIVRIQSIEASRSGQTLEGDETLFWWRFFTSVPGWAFGLGMVASWLFYLVLIYVKRRSESIVVRDAVTVGLVLAVLLVMVATTLAGIRGRVIRSVQPVVVVAEKLQLREGPSDRARKVRTPGNVVPGVVLVADSEREEWVRVSFPNGLSGWTSPESLRFISR